MRKTNPTIINIAFFVVMCLLIFSLSKNIFNLVFSLDTYSIHKRRLKQLIEIKEKDELNTYEAIEKYTQPVITYLFPRLSKTMPSLKKSNLEQLEKDLKMADWADTFSPETFIATSIMCKVFGVFIILLSFSFAGSTKILGFLWGAGLFFGFKYWFNSSLKGNKDTLFNDFPDFIRITSGYLSAGVGLVQAIQDSIKYVGPDWKPILQDFVVHCGTVGVDASLNNLKEAVDLFEVKEFVALVRLTIEQGGNARDGFLAQAEKITEMQRNLMLIKIGKRKTLSTVVQGPLLLCNMAILMLPTMGSMEGIM